MMVPDEILVKYRQRRQRDLEDCVRHVREGKMNFIEKVGHQLKGNALTFGYPELSLIGEELEAAATAEEEEALGVQKPVSEGGQQYTRNDLVRTANRNRLGIMLGGNNMMGISINPGGTLGGLRIPTGS